MTVSALAEFCGVTRPTVTQVLDRIANADPLTNDLPESLKSFAGKELRPLTNDLQGHLIVPDEVCASVTEYYGMRLEYEG